MAQASLRRATGVHFGDGTVSLLIHVDRDDGDHQVMDRDAILDIRFSDQHRVHIGTGEVAQPEIHQLVVVPVALLEKHRLVGEATNALEVGNGVFDVQTLANAVSGVLGEGGLYFHVAFMIAQQFAIANAKSIEHEWRPLEHAEFRVDAIPVALAGILTVLQDRLVALLGRSNRVELGLESALLVHANVEVGLHIRLALVRCRGAAGVGHAQQDATGGLVGMAAECREQKGRGQEWFDGAHDRDSEAEKNHSTSF